MAARVYLHIGLPKTGTTYLQQVLWTHRDRLREDGLLLPGTGHREHLWAALDAQGRGNLARRHRKAPGAWKRLSKELGGWSGSGLISHEFFCGARVRDITRIVEDLAPAEVHVVVTARHALDMLTAGWQEYVKNGGSAPADAVGQRRRGGSEFSWRTWDLGGVLRRWSKVVPPERVHVLTLPRPGEPPEQHWRNFAATVGITADLPLPQRAANQSLGVVQVELLRRLNSSLVERFSSPLDRGEWIRGRVAERWLAQQEREPFTLAPELVEECRRRARRAVRLLRNGGFDLVGDLDALVVPARLPAVRTTDDVTEDELMSAAGRLVADIMSELRDGARAADHHLLDQPRS